MRKIKLFILFVFILENSFSTTIKTSEECFGVVREGIDLMNEGKYTESLELLVQAEIAATEMNWDIELFLALNNIGVCYYLMYDYNEALNYYLRAYEISNKGLETASRMVVINNIALLYMGEKEYEKAYEFFIKAYDILAYKENEEEDKVINKWKANSAINIALVCNKMNRLYEARGYLDEALLYIKNDSNSLLMANIALSENFLLRKEYENCEQKAFEVLSFIKGDHNNQDDKRLTIFLILSRLYEAKGDYYNALHFAKEANKMDIDIESKEEVYERLAQLNTIYRNYDLALTYKDSIIFLKDSLYNVYTDAQYNSGKIKFEVLTYQQEILESKKRLEYIQKLFYSTIGFSVTIIFLIIMLLRNKSVKYKQKRKIIELELEREKKDHLLLEKQLKEEEILRLLEKEKLKNELELKNKKLTTKTLQLSNNRELLEEMIDSLSEKTASFNDRNIQKELHEIKMYLKQNNHKDNFFTHFEEINQGFIQRLCDKHPDLSSNDIRFISYVYMNLNNKEISSLINITIHSCRKRKERLAKKLNIPFGTTLYNYLINI